MSFSLAVTCLFTLTIAFAQQTPTELQRLADIYAIYSLTLTNPETSHGPDDNEIYVIGDTTIPGKPKDPCVRPPSGQEARFAEVMEDFSRRKDTPVHLEPRFQIQKLFRLLNPEEVDQFIRQQFSGGTLTSHPRIADLFRLSDVYFNRDRTLALTAISTYCGALCGLSKWKVFEKSRDGAWQEGKNWVTCSMIASLLPRSALSSAPDSQLGSIAKTAFETNTMFYDFHQVPYLKAFHNVMPS